MPPLYYVIGPSGAGKDSVLNWLRANVPPNAPLVFAHRYVTRAADAGGENHVALSEREFVLRRDAGLFCLHWESHGLHYGLGLELLAWMERGFAVVMNGSREYLAQASARLPSLVPVSITVHPDILRARLLARGRETADQIEARLERARAFSVRHPRLFALENNGLLEQAGEHLLARIELDLATAIRRKESTSSTSTISRIVGDTAAS